MSIPLVDLKTQYDTIRPAIDDAIQRVIANSAYIMGKEVADFEAAFAAYCGVKHAIGVSSGTSALFLTLLSYGVGPGDEVITTPFTFFATGEAISQVGATPVFVDIDPATYNIDPRRVEAAITTRTRAVVPVHLFGQPADMDTINSIARRRKLLVIEDAAQAHGATFNGKRSGSLGDSACFSFYPSKNLGCYGDGGAVVTNDDRLAERLRLLRDHGRISKYEHAELGYGHRLDGIQAAILSAKLPHLDEWNASRRRLAERYNRLLADTPLVTPSHLEHVTHVYHCYVVRTQQREALLAALQAADIGAGVHYPIPLHLQPAYRQLEEGPGSFPISEQMADEVVTLPLFPEMTNAQQDRVVEVIKAALA